MSPASTRVSIARIRVLTTSLNPFFFLPTALHHRRCACWALVLYFIIFMSCFDTHRWHVVPLVALWTLGSGLRLHHHGHRKLASDCCIFAFLILFLERNEITTFLAKGWSLSVDLYHSLVHSSTLQLTFNLVIAFLFIGVLFGRRFDINLRRSAKKLPSSSRVRSSRYPKPWIFPCKTTHARVFPTKHAFGYSYLQCGYPIIPIEATEAENGTSDGRDRELGNWWMRARADDYLERGNGERGFYKKLQSYLREQVSFLDKPVSNEGFCDFE